MFYLLLQQGYKYLLSDQPLIKEGGGGGWVEFLEFSQKERLRFLPQKGGVGNIGGVVLKKWYYLFLC